MERYLFSIILLFCSLCNAFAQLTIEDCYKMAENNYPLLRQYNLVTKTKDYNISNANKRYLPQLSVSAKVSYQSEVTKIPFDVPGIDVPILDKDQYMAQIGLEQVIWDGGIIEAQKNISQLQANVSERELDVEMYAIRERVNQLYFGILLLDAQLQQIELYQQELSRNYNKIESYIANGIANMSDLDIVKVEQLKTEQKKSIVLLTRKSYLEILSIFIDKPLDDSVALVKPVGDNLSIGFDVYSPELNLFSAQHDQLEAQKSILKSSYMPKLGLFAQAGYGRPALNMLRTDFRAFYLAGVNLTWNISSFYTKSNDYKKISLSQESIQTQRETFLFHKKIEVTQDQIAIDQKRQLMKQDDEIIRLRTNVKNAAEIKLEHGLITVTDLIKEIIEEDLAKQDKILHEIEYLQALYKLKYTTNN